MRHPQDASLRKSAPPGDHLLRQGRDRIGAARLRSKNHRNSTPGTQPVCGRHPPGTSHPTSPATQRLRCICRLKGRRAKASSCNSPLPRPTTVDTTRSTPQAIDRSRKCDSRFRRRPDRVGTRLSDDEPAQPCLQMNVYSTHGRRTHAGEPASRHSPPVGVGSAAAIPSSVRHVPPHRITSASPRKRHPYPRATSMGERRNEEGPAAKLRIRGSQGGQVTHDCLLPFYVIAKSTGRYRNRSHQPTISGDLVRIGQHTNGRPTLSNTRDKDPLGEITAKRMIDHTPCFHPSSSGRSKGLSCRAPTLDSYSVTGANENAPS